MVRRYIDSEYIFTPGASLVGTVRLPNETTVELGGFALIINVTAGVIIFDPKNPLKVGTVATDILTLTFNTTGMLAGDRLLVVYDDPTKTEDTSTLAKEAGGNLAGILASLQILDNIVLVNRALVTEDNSLAIKTATEALAALINAGAFVIKGAVTANAGTNLNTSALALDTTLVNGVNAILAALAAILTGPLNVNGSAVTVSGTVTADAGTDLNTSALGLETTLQDIKTATEAIVAIINGGALTITGTVIADAGNDLNTSALALEATMQDLKTSLQLLDNTVAGNELQVDVITQPVRAATTDSISSKDSTDVIQNGLVSLTPKFAIIDAATSGNNTLLAAVTSKKIRIISLYMVASAAVTARFESGADGTALSGQMQLAANGGFVLNYNPVGWFETASGVLFNLELSGAISVDGGFTYIEV